MLDVELLDPTFGGLNFSITGSMRTGIFVKEILDPGVSHGASKTNSSNKLKTGRDLRVRFSSLLMSVVDLLQVIVSSP